MSFPKKWSAGDGVDLPWIRNATLVSHVLIAIDTAILLLSQMAILRSHHHNMSGHYVEEGLHHMEDRRTCEARSEVRRPRRPRRQISTEMDEAGPQASFFVGKRWLTSSKITHSFAEVSASAGGTEGDMIRT